MKKEIFIQRKLTAWNSYVQHFTRGTFSSRLFFSEFFLKSNFNCLGVKNPSAQLACFLLYSAKGKPKIKTRKKLEKPFDRKVFFFLLLWIDDKLLVITMDETLTTSLSIVFTFSLTNRFSFVQKNFIFYWHLAYLPPYLGFHLRNFLAFVWRFNI